MKEIDGVKVIEGEVFTFETQAEYDAFLAGFDLGDKYGTEKDWNDGYREEDTVSVEFDKETLTIREWVAGEDDKESEDEEED